MIEALLLSVGEPQLANCVESLESQTFPLDRIIHIQNVCPQSTAYNQGLAQLKEDWFILMAGDIILDPDAVYEICREIKKDDLRLVFGYSFRIKDTFLNAAQGLGVFKTDILQKNPLRDRLSNDRSLGVKLTRHGLYMKRVDAPILGTHFDQPTEFQVFNRFFIYGIKYNSHRIASISRKLGTLKRLTGNQLYDLAIKAIDFGREKRGYPGSHNIEFDRKMYEEFKKS